VTTDDHDAITNRLAQVRARIDEAAHEAGRDPSEIMMLLAIKTLTADRVRTAIAAGGALLGQNRAQELVAVEPQISDLPHTTHFIGHLQSNKVNQVSRWTSCVQTVDTLDLAERLARARTRLVDDGESTGPLDVMIQVNTSGETSKSGVAPDAALDLAHEVAALGALRLRGLMTIGANDPDPGRVRASYDRLAEIRDEAAGSSGTASAVELSMGMSNDLEIAIAAGATIVRIGSAVFGARPAP
jgi:PLP dependent protein